MKIAIVTGSRHWTNLQAIWGTLDEEQPDIVVHGDCEYNGELRGADAAADAWARSHGVALLTSPAHFHKLGGKAGPLRNSFLVKVVFALLCGWPSQPHQVVVIAAPLPDSRGTPDLVGKAERHQWRVRLVEP